MSYRNHLFVSPLLENKNLKHYNDEDNSNVLVRGARGLFRGLGKIGGHIGRWADEGFSDGYKYSRGVKNLRRMGVEEG